MTPRPRAKTRWPPELQLISTLDDINALARTAAVAKKDGVYWIDGVEVRLREGQLIRCPVDAYVSYKGESYRRSTIT